MSGISLCYLTKHYLIHAYLIFSLFASSLCCALSFPFDLKYSSLQHNNQVTRKFEIDYFLWCVHCHDHIQITNANNNGCKIFMRHGQLLGHQWCRNSIDYSYMNISGPHRENIGSWSWQYSPSIASSIEGTEGLLTLAWFYKSKLPECVKKDCQCIDLAAYMYALQSTC